MMNQFEYDDCSCSVKIDLRIYNGLEGVYGGQLVPYSDETSKGAVTLANLNDTNGDGDINNDGIPEILDKDDEKVIAGSNGRDEVDLMKLEILNTGVFVSACPDLVLELKGSIKIWDKKTKETASSLTIPISDLPKTLWVEATSASSNVRDIEIKAKIGSDVKDEVKATAVWLNFIKKYKTNTTNPSASSLGIDMLSLKNLLDIFMPSVSGYRYGLGEFANFLPVMYGGSCPTGSYTGNNSAWAASILTEYEIQPSDLKGEPNMLVVKFDFARQVDAVEEQIRLSGFTWGPTPVGNTSYMNGNEGSNDDGGNDDEDLTPPSSSNLIYSFDAPGFCYEAFFNPGGAAGSEFSYYETFAKQ